MTKRLKFIAIAVILAFGMTFILSQPASMSAHTVDSFRIDNIPKGTQVEPAASTVTPDRSGYWAQVTRSASVRRNLGGGPEVRQGFRLQAGQYFHVETRGGNASWALGFACPNGGRFCNSRENLQGFVLRSALGDRVSANPSETPNNLVFAAFSGFETGVVSSQGKLAMYIDQNTAGSNIRLAASTSRTVCAREVWMRNDRLHPIGILRKGDRFEVERYTDGSGNSGRPVWALGRAYGGGVKPQGLQGRVMVNSLCR